MNSASVAGPGFAGKPLVEKIKLVVLFALMGGMIALSQPQYRLFIPGALLTFLGAVVRVWAAGHLTRDQRLTTSGPYEYTRNPFYLGRFLVLVGLALMSGLQNLAVWAIFLLGAAFFFLGYMPRKERREGGRLETMFGDEYLKWKANVPSLFPRRLRPYRTQPRPWSRELFFAGDDTFSGNKELPTTLVTLLLIALFFLRLVLAGRA